MHETRHTDSGGISMYQGTITQQGWLQEIDKAGAVLMLHKITNTDNQTRKQHTVVGRQLIRSPSRHVKSQWHNDDIWKRSQIFHIMQAEDQYKEFYRGRIGGCQWCDGQVLWTRHFLTAHGMAITTTTIYQDNKSTILLAENGSTSSSKWMKHLDVCSYFVTDKIKKG